MLFWIFSMRNLAGAFTCKPESGAVPNPLAPNPESVNSLPIQV